MADSDLSEKWDKSEYPICSVILLPGNKYCIDCFFQLDFSDNYL